jgi:hypothetical protein
MDVQSGLGGLNDGRHVVGVAVHGNAALDDVERESFSLQVAIIDANQGGELGAAEWPMTRIRFGSAMWLCTQRTDLEMSRKMATISTLGRRR